MLESQDKISYQMNYREYKMEEFSKKKNLTNKNIFFNILANIPGFGTAKSLKIVNKFQTFAKFLEYIIKDQQTVFDFKYDLIKNSEAVLKNIYSKNNKKSEIVDLIGKDSAVKLFNYFNFEF
jgi:ERCC4-type nuclease